VQSAIDAASNGDILILGKGTFTGEIDFRGKQIKVRGQGPETILRGMGRGSVVKFSGGENRRAVLDSVQIEGGRSENGGGIFILNASPRVQREPSWTSP